MLLSAQTATIYTSTMCVCACHCGLALRPQIPTRGTGSGSRLVSISVYVFIYQFIDKHVEWECSSVVHFKTHTRALVLSQSTWDALIFFLLCELFQVFVVLFFMSSKTSSAAAGSHRVCQKHHKYPVVVIVVFSLYFYLFSLHKEFSGTGLSFSPLLRVKSLSRHNNEPHLNNCPLSDA